jgi:hypothetical protein
MVDEIHGGGMNQCRRKKLPLKGGKDLREILKKKWPLNANSGAK